MARGRLGKEASSVTTLDPNDPFEAIVAECVELRRRKSRDYQNPNSNVRQAMHYRRGIGTLHDMVNQKTLRAQSLLENSENDPEAKANFESIEDTYKDIVNYAVFCVMWLRGKIDGQTLGRDIFNRQVPPTVPPINAVTNKPSLLMEMVGRPTAEGYLPITPQVGQN